VDVAVHDLDISQQDTLPLYRDEIGKHFKNRVMVAPYIAYLHPMPGETKDLLHHGIVRGRPVPAALELPEVEDVSHQIQVFAVIMTQKGEQSLRLAAPSAQMKIGNKNGAAGDTERLLSILRGGVRRHGKPLVRSRLGMFCSGSIAANTGRHAPGRHQTNGDGSSRPVFSEKQLPTPNNGHCHKNDLNSSH
jgi:hypothetical protein